MECHAVDNVLNKLENKILNDKLLFKEECQVDNDMHPEYILGVEIMYDMFLDMIDSVR